MNFIRRCRILILLAVVSNGIAGTALARPPAEMKLTYDAEKKNLHAEIRHVTSNPRKHFIRKLIIYKNGDEIENRFYVQQTTAAMLIEDVSLEAVTGDVIQADAICNEAGRKETTLVIP